MTASEKTFSLAMRNNSMITQGSIWHAAPKGLPLAASFSARLHTGNMSHGLTHLGQLSTHLAYSSTQHRSL